MKFNITHRIIALLLLVPTFLLAQEERKVRMIYFEAGEEAPTELTILQEKEDPIDVKLLPTNFCNSFVINKSNSRIIIAPKGTIKDEDGEWLKYPKINIPKTWGKALVFLSKNDANTLLPIKGHAVRADDSNFKPGGLMIFNFTDFGIVGTVGDLKVNLGPKKQVLLGELLKERGSLNAKLDYVDLKNHKNSYVEQALG